MLTWAFPTCEHLFLLNLLCLHLQSWIKTLESRLETRTSHGCSPASRVGIAMLHLEPC